MNARLDDWAGKQQDQFDEVLQILDQRIDRLHQQGPISAVLAKVTRIVVQGHNLFYRSLGYALHDILGFNRFWTMFLLLI